MANAKIRLVSAAGFIAEAASAAKLVFLWRLAWITEARSLTLEPVPAIVVIDVRFGTAFVNNMSADFSGHGGRRYSKVPGDSGEGCTGFKLLLKQDALIQCHLFVSRSDTSFLTGIQHSYCTTDLVRRSAIERCCKSPPGGRSRGRTFPPSPCRGGRPLSSRPDTDAIPCLQK